MKVSLLVFLISFLNAFLGQAQDTINVSIASATVKNYKIVRGDFWIKLALQKPIVVSLDGDCPARPTVYTIFRKTENGWTVAEDRKGVSSIKQCGPTQVSGLRIFLPFRLNEKGIYKIVLPIGAQNYYSGEIEIVDQK